MESPTIERVIVISIDGLRADAAQQADMPTLQRLAEEGAVSWTAQTIFPPATVPAHTSMLTGLTPNLHGVIWNFYRAEPIESFTFLTLLQEAGYSTAMITGKEKFIQFQQHPDLQYDFMRLGDRSVIDRTLDLLDEGYEVLFVHLPNPDFFGHLIGWMTEVYLFELSNTDAQLTRLIDYLTDNDWLDTTLLIITSDHGGHNREHGSNIPEDMTVPLILHGAEIDAGTELTGDIVVTQVASTVLSLYGIDLLENMASPIQLSPFTER